MKIKSCILLICTTFVNINADWIRDNRTEIVKDTETGFMWSDSALRKATAEGAESYCRSLSLGGFNDWRVPSREEAQTLPLTEMNYYKNFKPFKYKVRSVRTSTEGYAFDGAPMEKFIQTDFLGHYDNASFEHVKCIRY